MTVVAQHLHVAVGVFPAEGQRAHMVHVHPIRGKVAQAPVTPRGAPFLHSPAEPRSSVPAGCPSPAPCASGTDTRSSLVRGVVRLAAAPMGRGFGAVDTAHVRPLGGSLWCARPETRTRELCGVRTDLPEGAGTAHLWPLGQRACTSSPARAGLDTVGTARADNPFRRPRSRGGYSWAVRSPLALPHDPSGHPSNGGAWCTGNAERERALRPPVSPSGWVRGIPALFLGVVGTSEFLPAVADSDSRCSLFRE